MLIGEPIVRWFFFAYLWSTKAPSLPSCEGTAVEPCFQRRWITWAMFGATPVRLSVLPRMRAEPARTPEIAVTFGALASARSSETERGVNVSVDVSA